MDGTDGQAGGPRTETTVREFGQAGELVRETTTVEYPSPPARQEISTTAASTQVNTAAPPFGFRTGRMRPPTAS